MLRHRLVLLLPQWSDTHSKTKSQVELHFSVLTSMLAQCSSMLALTYTTQVRSSGFTDKKPQSNVFETKGYMHASTWMRGVKSTTQTSMPPVPMFDIMRWTNLPIHELRTVPGFFHTGSSFQEVLRPHERIYPSMYAIYDPRTPTRQFVGCPDQVPCDGLLRTRTACSQLPSETRLLHDTSTLLSSNLQLQKGWERYIDTCCQARLYFGAQLEPTRVRWKVSGCK